MRITIRHPASQEQGSILASLVIAVVLLSTIATVTAYVAQTFRIATRRENMVQALQFAEGGAAIGCSDLQRAFKNNSSTIATNLIAAGYSQRRLPRHGSILLRRERRARGFGSGCHLDDDHAGE